MPAKKVPPSEISLNESESDLSQSEEIDSKGDTELKQVRARLQAVSDIRDFLISRNISNFFKSDAEIVEEATQLVELLYTLEKRNIWVTRQINKIIDLMYQGWKPFEGHLYFFSTPEIPHQAAKADCIKRDAVMVIIMSPAEETFIEATVRYTGKSYWIALQKVKVRDKEEWRWINGEKPDRTYWAAGQPSSSQPGPYCAEITKWCYLQHKCWGQIPCLSNRGWICKMAPHPDFVI
ncbi:CD209 antigen-like protein C isoform X3 [Paroedura picta]|uniref:CD209 antigen-like protein C isoform X3 n=1 Tax=Paroedura picta TaxID=143630 RepID=UPI004055C5AA